MQCGNGSTNLYVIFLVLSGELWTCSWQKPLCPSGTCRTQVPSSVCMERNTCDTEQNTTTSLEKLAGYSQLGTRLQQQHWLQQLG